MYLVSEHSCFGSKYFHEWLNIVFLFYDVAGLESEEPITWSDELNHAFFNAQTALHDNRSITLHQSNDQLWIVTGNAVKKHGLGATLCVKRNKNVHLAGFLE